MHKKKKIDVHDSFEDAKLSALWEKSRLEERSLAFANDHVKDGRQALAITVRPRDTFEAGKAGGKDSERDELLEARRLVSKEDGSYEYSFSIFFPKDFPIVPTRLVIAQWKQYCPDGAEACDDDSPVLALRYINGEIRVTQDLNKKEIVLWRKKSEFRNRWMDFVVQARFTPSDAGRVNVWLDREQVVQHRGATSNVPSSESGYHKPVYFYFKMGLYRDLMQQPMTVYIDAYRKREVELP